MRLLTLFIITFSVGWQSAIGYAAPPNARLPKESKLGEYVPYNGYIRNTRKLQLVRRAAGAAAMPLAPGQQLSVRGTRSIPVLCVSFQNRDKPFEAAQYQAMLFGPGSRTLTSYYDNVSEGLLKVTGKTLGWYKAPKNDDFYEGSDNGLGGTAMGQLLEFAFKSADAEVDFGEFDNDGPDGIPNSGDDDGIVDTIFLIHPEKGGECGSSKNIWSHSWHYSEGLGHAAPFRTGDPVRDAAGIPVPGRFIGIDDYTIQPGLSCDSNNLAKEIIEVGVFCHEYGHALGLPDLYDRTPDGNADSNGIGAWCLMAGGSYGGDMNHAECPCEMSAWCKYYLGWAAPKLLEEGQFDFDPADEGNPFYRIEVPQTNGLEYFLIEYRRPREWDQFLPTGGLAIWHIDEQVGASSQTWPFAPANGGQNDSANKVSATPPRMRNPHQLVALVQADGQMQLESSANPGDAGDLFKSGTFGHDPTGKKGSQSYSGKTTNLMIDDITVHPDSVVAKVSLSNGQSPAAPPAAAPAVALAGSVEDQPVDDGGQEANSDALANYAAYGSASRAFDAYRAGNEEIPAPMAAVLAKTPTHVLTSLPITEQKAAFVKQALESRTTNLNDKERLPPETILSALRANLSDADAKEAIVRLSPSGQSVEVLANLSLERKGVSSQEDAQSRIEGDWKPLFGGAALVARKPRMHGSAAHQRFQQTVLVGDRALPIFGKQCDFHYVGNELKGVTADLLDVPVTVAPAENLVTDDEGKAIVARTLGIPGDVIESGDEGVFLLQDEPTGGRVARKYSVQVAPKQKDVAVYVDSSTGQILSIE